MRIKLTILGLFCCMAAIAGQRESLWPSLKKMPDAQKQQIAAMTDVSQAPGFNPDKYRMPFLEWFEAPSNPNGSCMILISGGSYKNTCDVEYVKQWNKRFTEEGFQCVNLVYRTPRPEGLPIYQSAWEDGQRAVRMVRNEALKRGYDPSRIGTVSMSAGSHLAVLLATSSSVRAYAPVDKIDSLPCNINWAVVNAPAYVTTDGETGTRATYEGYGPDVKLSSVFKFDEKTCPMCLCHGGLDVYTPNGSTLIYRRLRRMGVPAELHLFPDVGHKALGLERSVEFLRQTGFSHPIGKEEPIMDRFPSDSARAIYAKEDVWPSGAMPDVDTTQCIPYIEWHIPAKLSTKAIQIIYSGGSYKYNDPDGKEVAPVRRYLNDKGMAVVTLKYRTPRPQGKSKHLTAWQDLQRTIKIVRSKAASYGLDPDRIGIMGSSAGGHLTLMGVTSSLHQSYLPKDAIDKLSCSVQWGIAIYPAYVLSDGSNNHNTGGGNYDSATIMPEFSFDLKTAPTLFIHGDADGWAAMNSVKTWEKMRAMGVQSELHTLALRKHCFNFTASPGTGSYTYMDRIWEFLSKKGLNK